MDTAAPVHDCPQSLGLYVSQLGCPVTAETGADHGKPIGIDFGPVGQIIQRRDIDLMSLGGRQHRAFACAGAVQHKTAPSFLHEPLREDVAFFFPIIDAAPVHDQWRRSFLG